MKRPVRCNACGTVIGHQEYITYGEDHSDYGEIEPNEDFGGQDDNGRYCDICLVKVQDVEDEHEN